MPNYIIVSTITHKKVSRHTFPSKYSAKRYKNHRNLTNVKIITEAEYNDRTKKSGARV